MRKEPLTDVEHLVVGPSFALIARQLDRLVVWYDTYYLAEVVRPLKRIERSFDHLRHTLKDLACADQPPHQVTALAALYFPELLPWSAEAQDPLTEAVVMDRLRTIAGQWRIFADRLFQGYPVALGDRLLRDAHWLEYEASELPYRRRRATAS
jgi:hypothetical protein